MSEPKWLPEGHRTAKGASVLLHIPYDRVLKWCRENKVKKLPQGWAISEAKMKQLAKKA